MNVTSEDDHVDDAVDTTIQTCLNLNDPQSFFLYAGAGSGKTRSLVNALRYVSDSWGERLALRSQQVAVITYTNAACNEIKQRLKSDPLIDVRTIHSFAWSLIEGYDTDIRLWLTDTLQNDIDDLKQKQPKGGKPNKTSTDRQRSIESKEKRLSNLPNIIHFIYSPTGDNNTYDSLSHPEVIAMTAEWLNSKSTLQRVLIDHYPFLLIDESQDTISDFMDAILNLQKKYSDTFCVGLLGDTMQRIYGHGKQDLAKAIPPSWARPAKQMNHRCPARVIRLLNAIRAGEDGLQQRGRSDTPNGYVRLFLIPEKVENKFEVEARIIHRMAEISGDQEWTNQEKVKALTLEHLMAARRLGFQDFFSPLHQIAKLRTGLLDGTAPGVSFFCHEVLPVIRAITAGDPFMITAAVRRSSPLLDRKRLEEAGDHQKARLQQAKEATESLRVLLQNDKVPTLHDVLTNVALSGLFHIPNILEAFVDLRQEASGEDLKDSGEANDEGNSEDIIKAWGKALQAPCDQIEKYYCYINGDSKFGTLQGVKGLEFPRVMGILNDDESRGFLFSFEKLFGTKEQTQTDIENKAAGRDSTIERTRRLFYVTCSRAQKSLAIVCYTAKPEVAKEEVIQNGWFEEDEIELFQ